jgi:hypothetical protein
MSRRLRLICELGEMGCFSFFFISMVLELTDTVPLLEFPMALL